MIEILKNNPRFLRFWIATIASQLASRMHSLILIWIIYKWTNSTMAVGIAMVAASLPSVLISPLSGSLIDRHNKITIMMIADFVRLSILVAFAYLSFENMLNTTIMVVGTIGISMASAFFNPASLSVLPTLVKSDDIPQANAIGQISVSSSSVLGPLFGAALIATLGVLNAFIASAILFFISVLLLLNIKDIHHKVQKLSTSVTEDIKEGFKLIKKYNIVYKMIGNTAIVNFFFSSTAIIVPVIAHADAKRIGYLMSAVGAGMLSSSLYLSYNKLRFKPNIILTNSFIIMGLSFILLGFTTNLYLQILEIFMIGVGLSIFNITLISLYQTKLPREALGKIMALISAISLSLQPISYGIMGIVVDYVGIMIVLAISGLVILISSWQVYNIKELNS